MAELLAQVAAVRVSGVGEAWEEHTEGVCGVGAAVRTGTADRYALAIAAPLQRFERTRDTLRHILMRCVSSIEASLGIG